MKYEQLKKESEENFRRLTGIKKATFVTMLSVLNQAEAIQKSSGGKPNKLSLENRLLMMLEYWRE